MPADAWYSIDPYIDAQVRKQRFENIVVRLHDSGFKVGAWAERVIADVKEARDRARAGEGPRRHSDLVAPAGQPTLLETTPTHKLWHYQKRYYAVPLALGDVDIKNPATASLEGVISTENETLLRVELEHAKSWADTRGQYDAQERQRIAGSLFRAGSAIGDDYQETSLTPRPLIIRCGREFIAVERDILASLQAPAAGSPLNEETVSEAKSTERSLWPSRQGPVAWTGGDTTPLREAAQFAGQPNRDIVPSENAERAPDGPGEFVAIRAVSKGAEPSMLTSFKDYRYNLIEYDGLFYGVPHGLQFDWNDPDSVLLPGVIVGESAQKAMRTIRERTQISEPKKPQAVAEKGSGPAGQIAKVPQLLDAIEDYNIVSYEGFIYGLPQALGPIDLAQTDVIETEGVIRDVSRQVVENEIHDIVAMRRQAAE